LLDWRTALTAAVNPALVETAMKSSPEFIRSSGINALNVVIRSGKWIVK
jgi:hypothetical protein